VSTHSFLLLSCLCEFVFCGQTKIKVKEVKCPLKCPKFELPRFCKSDQKVGNSKFAFNFELPSFSSGWRGVPKKDSKLKTWKFEVGNLLKNCVCVDTLLCALLLPPSSPSLLHPQTHNNHADNSSVLSVHKSKRHRHLVLFPC
jgi:hypothetical protein